MSSFVADQASTRNQLATWRPCTAISHQAKPTPFQKGARAELRGNSLLDSVEKSVQTVIATISTVILTTLSSTYSSYPYKTESKISLRRENGRDSPRDHLWNSLATHSEDACQ